MTTDDLNARLARIERKLDAVTLAAYDHVESLKLTPDAMDGPYPLWHGWAIREAFIAGAKWQKLNKRKQK